MNRLAITLLSVLSTSGFALAAVVNYDTAQSHFTCTPANGLDGCGTQTVTIGDKTSGDAVVMTYVGSTVTGLDATPSSISSLGRLLISCYGGGLNCSPETVTGLGIGLSLVINQTDVGASGESFNGSIATALITGLFSGNWGYGLVNWSNGNAVGSNGPHYLVNYSVLNNVLGLVVPASNNCSNNPCEVVGPTGDTTIQAWVAVKPLSSTLGAVPEPATYLLLAGGLVGMSLLRRRK